LGGSPPAELPVSPGTENANGLGASDPPPTVVPACAGFEKPNGFEDVNEKGEAAEVKVPVVAADEAANIVVDVAVGEPKGLLRGVPKLKAVGFLGGLTAPFTDEDPKVKELVPVSDGNAEGDDAVADGAAENGLLDTDKGLSAFGGANEKVLLPSVPAETSKGNPNPILGESAPPAPILVIFVADPPSLLLASSLPLASFITGESCGPSPMYAFRTVMRCCMYWLKIWDRLTVGLSSSSF